MEQNVARTIDEQGRILLPSKIMRLLGWGAGDEIAFSNTNRAIVLSMRKRHEGPRCFICSKLEQKVHINDTDICGNCLQAIVAADASKSTQ